MPRVRSYRRKLKNGKTVRVRAHTRGNGAKTHRYDVTLAGMVINRTISVFAPTRSAAIAQGSRHGEVLRARKKSR